MTSRSVVLSILCALGFAPVATAAEKGNRLSVSRPAGLGDWKYRFIVPVDVRQVPRSVSKIDVKCEICQALGNYGTSCDGRRIVGTTPLPLVNGTVAVNQVEVLINEHLMVQTGQNSSGPTTENLKYFCFLRFDGRRPFRAQPPSNLPAAPGSNPVVQVPVGSAGEIPE